MKERINNILQMAISDADKLRAIVKVVEDSTVSKKMLGIDCEEWMWRELENDYLIKNESAIVNGRRVEYRPAVAIWKEIDGGEV